MTRTPISQFRLKAEDVTWTGDALSRPECVLCERDGTLWVGDKRAAFTRHDPDGRQVLLGSMGPLPNGMAMDRDGRILVANLETGVLFRVERDGRETAILDGVEGGPLGSLNFAYFDPAGRAWLTISTLTVPRLKALDEPVADGLLLRLHGDGAAEVVARDFFFANEVRVDRAMEWLYIAETTAGRIRRAPLSAEGALGAFEPFGADPLYPGARTDGIAFDCEGNLWATEISRNALVVLTPEGEAITVWEDPEGEILRHPTSVAFGGPDLRTVYVGSLVMDRLFTFRSPIAGEPMYHWDRGAATLS